MHKFLTVKTCEFMIMKVSVLEKSKLNILICHEKRALVGVRRDIEPDHEHCIQVHLKQL